MRIIFIGISLWYFLLVSPARAAEVNFEDAFSPHQGATKLVVKVIDRANQSICVAAYSFTSRPIAEALIAAHARGIDVQIVVDKSQRQRRIVNEIRSHGIPIRINYKYVIMHNKFMVIDGDTLELGSFNYTAAAENKNAENVLVIHDQQQITADYERQWRKIWDEGELD